MKKHVLFSVNSSWNVINFRRGVIGGLLEMGCKVTVVAPRDEYSEQIAELGADYHELPMDQQGKSIVGDFKLFLSYLSIIRKLKPDVYVSYTIKPNVYGSLAAHCLGVPTVNNVAGLGNVFVHGGWLQKLVKRLYAVALSRASCVFFQNPDDRKLFIEEKLVCSSQAELLPGSGVDLTEFEQAEYVCRPSTQMEFLFIGRLLRDKGVMDLVEATKIVKQEFPNIKVSLLGFVGVANPSAISKEEVDNWVSEGLVNYYGPTDDVRPYLRNADCMILPTAYREGTPRSLIEAGAIGIPLITTNMPGCREILDDGVNGFLCEPKNPQSIAEAMLKMLQMASEQRQQMANASREKAENEYDEEIVIAKYKQAVQEALNIN